MPQMPGITVGATETPREFMLIPSSRVDLPAGITMDSAGYDGGNTDYEYKIRAGWLVGKLTSGGRYVPCKRTRADGADTTSTTLVVDNSYAFKAGQSIIVGTNSANVIVSIDYSTHTITLTDAITWSDNDVCKGNDGSETCRGILGGTVKLKTVDNLTAAHASASLTIGGFIDKSQLLGDYDSIVLDGASVQWLKAIWSDELPTAAAAAFTNITASGTLAVTGAATLSSTLAVTTSISCPLLLMTGTTGNQEIRLTDNLADALSVKITSGNDIFSITTTNSAEALNVAANLLCSGGFEEAAVTLTPDDAEGAGNSMTAGKRAYTVTTVTNDANDFVVLPAIADVPIGHTIRIACSAGGNFELRTPASSGTTINGQDCDGTKEYLCTDTELVTVVKLTTAGWVAYGHSALGAAVAAVVPD